MTTTPPNTPDERSGDESRITDDRLDAFLREAAEGGGAPAPKEPSARARMVTARLREQDGTPQGWRTGPAWQEMNGTRTRRRRVGAVTRT
ncbi:hypothetical protein GCM10022384_42460 [Streptomyces marokkonensis]|uniref:Uncharacterized protein n=1 Tax=Streptomyces marokkonensis TaxID=324855 RepID=A0ABP7QZ56_9ACTN